MWCYHRGRGSALPLLDAGKDMTMRDIFIDFGRLMKSDFFRDRLKMVFGKDNRTLHSRRIEDEIYKEVREDWDDRLKELEDEAQSKLPGISDLSRDVFQSLFSLSVREKPEEFLSPMAKKFHRPILRQLMESPIYPALKAICEGNELPAFDATEQFMEQVCQNLDQLMDAANGPKKSLSVLEKETARQEQRLEELQNLLNRHDPNQPDPALEKKILRTANRAYSKVKQLAALEKMVEDNLLRSQEQVEQIMTSAGEAAIQKADETAKILLSWGTDPGNMQPDALNGKLLQRVRQNEMLVKISQYLGRLREMMRVKRKNATVYGRGEKYGIELGNRLRSVLSSEYGLLAAPATVPLFLRKYQRGALLQYKRREKVCKGQGDKIVCLDESGSTMENGGDNAAWGKALAYALLDITGFHRRNFALVHFSDYNDFRTDIFRPGQYTPEDVLSSASTFINGGTDYETPLREAIRLIDTGEFRQADIVFITDGECQISEAFAQELQKKKAAAGFTITGILMDQASPGMKFTLTPFCDEIYRISELGGEQIADRLLSGRI